MIAYNDKKTGIDTCQYRYKYQFTIILFQKIYIVKYNGVESHTFSNFVY